ncbi:uncharacterized protein A4U43_C04F31870 [Asparagus officinalis]|uniref:Uncharacterized protein n=1 Tax=Asparagus officinalis TaxID=4686 RepID=A0A5P1F525_ASPOF|nr:uncharacterized protein LOC109839146 [Asparagus officinalis]XP_020263165.1 uncharacterized protein LOC109839146 [Asparagus officinalis]ONK73468.1 uncharacterized protein A4U43_C04F31870 [Asparagus officinalis]
MGNPRANSMLVDTRRSLGFPMENPFSFKVLKVFTGFGVGCGIGIGAGTPIYWGAIPMLQQVMSATRGATDAFSGVGKHVNGALRKVGMKNIQAGIGCGVGIGHGFGVGIALKPGVVQRIQSSVIQSGTKLMLNMGLAPESLQNNVNALTGTSSGNLQSSSDVDLASKNRGNSFQLSRENERDYVRNTSTVKGTTDRPLESRTEKVVDSFLQNPVFKHEEKKELNALAESLQAENNVLQVLLKQQQTIQGLMEENQKLQRILVEDLKVPPSKLHMSSESFVKSNFACSNCFECRRRMRKTGR